MARKFMPRAGLSVLALTVALAGAASPAGAEQRYLFDILFGDRRQPQRTEAPPRQPERQAPQQQAAPASLPKVSGPSFYDYRAEGLVTVDFAAIAVATEEGETTPLAEALAALAGYELMAEKPVAEALVAHYSANPEFLWVEDGRPNARAQAVLDVLGEAASYGLSDADYAVFRPLAAANALNAPEQRLKALARFEMSLSARALRYARDAHMGRVDPNKLSGYHDFARKPLEEVRVLERLARAPRPAAYLESLHPQNAEYAALRGALAELRTSADKEIVVDPKTFVRPGERNPEFSKILRIIERDADAAFREEFGELLEEHAGSDTYARELVPLIKAAQRRHDLNPDGIIGRQTVGAIAGDSRAVRIDKVLLAMERLRWHPSRLGSTRVMLNAAAFTAEFIENDETKLAMRTIVGRSSTQTYFFHDEIEYVEFNPYWGVPRSILVNQKLSQLVRDPGYLDRAGYEVTDASGRRIPSAAINWGAYGANIPFNVRQRPGPRNALGELKIMFPNRHAIYMHDTPEKHLFDRDTRAFSAGCVRLQDPRAMAAAVLGTTVEDIARSVAGGRTVRRDAPKKIPVYVGYFTAWPDAEGHVSYHPDVYGRDAHLIKALGKIEERRAAAS